MRQTHKRKTNKRKTNKRKTNKRKTYNGGDTTLSSQSFNSFGFANGATSPREAALLHEKNNNAMQHKMNQMSGGKRSGYKRSGYKQRGGTIEVPSFPPIGGIKQAYSATDLSVGGNTNVVKGINDAQNDCFATDTCQSPTTVGGSKYAKQKRMTKRTRMTKRSMF